MTGESSEAGSPRTILTVKEVIRERMIECSDKALSQFKGAICPVYGSTPNGQPEQLGSCVLLQIAGKPCLMTAAHLIDSNNATSLYIGGKDLTLIEAEFSVSPAPGGHRKNDRYDFAIAELTTAFVAGLGSARFIRDDEISSFAAPTSGHLFCCLGYPNSQNRHFDSNARKIRPRRGRYVSNIADRPELLKKLKISGKDHLIIDHRKYSRDEGGNRVSSYALSGFSGGAVIDLGKLSSPEVATGIVPCEPRLAALFIEYYQDHQAIVATRVDTILKAYVAKQNQRKPETGASKQ
jgi:hypothetical protein